MRTRAHAYYTEGMTPTETAQANLISYYLGDDEQPYFDWSVSTADGVMLEVGDGTDAVQVDLTLDQMATLHRRLGAFLAVYR